VHADLVIKNWSNIIIMLFLGDDMVMACRNELDNKNLRKDIAVNFNMQSKDSINHDYGEFCHYLMYNTEVGMEIGPDIPYKRLRYEVPNSMDE